MPRKQASVKRVTATEFQKNFGAYRSHALREPVAVTNHGRPETYHISAAAFEELEHLRKSVRRAYRVEDLPESTIRAMVKSRMDKKYDYLNKLLDD